MNQSQQMAVHGSSSGSKVPTASNNAVTDCLPNELLITLFDSPPAVEKTHPTRLPSLSVSTVATRKPPANAWNHSTQRRRFNHLVARPPCVCGAGRNEEIIKRNYKNKEYKKDGKAAAMRQTNNDGDVSFLYDVSKKNQQSLPIPQPTDDVSTPIRSRAKDLTGNVSKSVDISNSLVPEDYRIVRNKGVLGLEYWADKYTTLPEDHERHLVVFPSMKPSSRFEVLQLKKTLDAMLDKAGVLSEIDGLTAPTQMHQLLELIKKEQNIYNIVFHEIIRQVSVECIERGELLAMVRQRYADLLSQVPKHIKSLHDEILGQKALDRKLAEELVNFHEKVFSLTSELNSVKEQDIEVIKQAQEVQKDIKAALNEASKNANTLAEYQELYQLQRYRLENEVEFLSDELQLWCETTFRLASKVLEEHCLNSTRQLCVSDKSWSRLASRFTVLLHDRDMSELIATQSDMDSWRGTVDELDRQVRSREDESVKRVLRLLLSDLQEWIKLLSKSGVPSNELGLLADKISSWDQTLLEVLTNFDGETVLAGRDMLNAVRLHFEAWSNRALGVILRQETVTEKQHVLRPRMMLVIRRVEKLLSDYETRLTGENGVVDELLSVASGLKVWRSRRIDVDSSMDEPTKAQVLEQIKRWAASLEESIENTGKVDSPSGVEANLSDNDENISMDTAAEVVELVQDWLRSFQRNIDSEDAKLTQQVSVLHQQMIRWTTEAIISLVAPRYRLSNEVLELSKSVHVDQLTIDAKSLSVALTDFTKILTRRCIESTAYERRTRGVGDEDQEHIELSRLTSECEQWKKLSGMVLTELATVQVHVQTISGEEHCSQDSVTGFAEGGELTTMVLPVEEQCQRNLPNISNTVHQRLATDKFPSSKGLEELHSIPMQSRPASSLSTETLGRNMENNSHLPVTDSFANFGLNGTRSVPNPAATKWIELDNANGIECLDADDHLEVIGYDSTTRTVVNGSSNNNNEEIETSGYKSFEYVRFLQERLLATESRAQEAEERAVSAQAALIDALEKLRAVETSVRPVMYSSTPHHSTGSVPPSFKEMQPRHEEDTARNSMGKSKSSSKMKNKKTK